MVGQPTLDVSLVSRLAFHPETNRVHVSFASKFCHFFINQEMYPILDDVACLTLKHFLRHDYATKEPRYESFLENLKRLRSSSSELEAANLTNAELDRFLWLFGLWKRARNGDNKINSEAKRVFLDPPPAIIRRLDPN